MKFTGVIEGFYGRPWTITQREELIEQFVDFGGLNTYIYAPKDDFKHRQQWRELYTQPELNSIKNVVEKCHENNITFVYAIAPGLDISYSSKTDYNLLIAKINQLKNIGAKSLALLFDDIPEKMNETDEKAFDSFAQAHAIISNKIFSETKLENYFFCPTVYCLDQSNVSLDENDYLFKLSNLLYKEFNIFWTGPSVITPEITSKHIQELKKVFDHPIVIWDNLFANDYDLHRCFMGPFSGRDEIKNEVEGILLNPNCQFELNYIPIHTFSSYFKNGHVDLQLSIEKWYNQFESVIDIDELKLLIDVNYLPDQLGSKGIELVKKLKTNNYDDIAQLSWDLLHKLAKLNNRELFHAIYPFAWELFATIKAYKDGISVEFLPNTKNGSMKYNLSTSLDKN